MAESSAAGDRPVWWSKAILAVAIVAAALLPLGPLGAKLGVWGFPIGLLSLAVAMGLAALGVVIGVVALIAANKRNLFSARKPIYIAMVINAVVIVFMGNQFFGAQSVPPIHNISTDVDDPPQFDQIVAIRGEQSNPLELDAALIGPLQEEFYPWLETYRTEQAGQEVFDKAVQVVQDMGLELVKADADAGLVEATATTFWFGFKDDVAIRIRPDGTGSAVDVRSISRVGVGDLGANANRIREILERLAG